MGIDSESKEAIRNAADVTADHLGRIASILAAAARDIAVELGKWVDDIAAVRTTGTEQPKGAEPVS